MNTKARKITAHSLERGRAHASVQHRLGLKVGGTMTLFSVSDGVQRWEIETWGASPAIRRAAAIEAFVKGGSWAGRSVMAKVKNRGEVTK